MAWDRGEGQNYIYTEQKDEVPCMYGYYSRHPQTFSKDLEHRVNSVASESVAAYTAGVSNLLASLGHTGAGRIVLGHT